VVTSLVVSAAANKDLKDPDEEEAGGTATSI